MSDRISLRAVTARARHGVLAEEKVTPQPFIVDLDLEADLSGAGASDRLADTVNYATIAAQAHRTLTGQSVDLLENLAERIARVCLQEPHVEAVRVTLHKPEAPVGVPCGDVEVEVRRERAAQVVIGMGANLSWPERRLADAVRQLARLEGVRLRALSPLYKTDPVGGPPDQPIFHNAVLLATTRLTPHSLLVALHGIEDLHGRRRDVRWGPRTLDLDLIRYYDPILGEARFDDERLTLPHPRAVERAFVLAPWLAVDPDARLPRGTAVKDRTLADDVGLRVRDLIDELPQADLATVRPGPDWPAFVHELVMVAPQ